MSRSNIEIPPLVTPEQIGALCGQLIARLHEVRALGNGERVLVRAEIEIEPCDVLAWLSAQQTEEKVYWRERGGVFESAGIGVADVIAATGPVDTINIFQRMSSVLGSCHSYARYYGGFRFDMGAKGSQPEKRWNAYGSARFVLPRIELTRCGRKMCLAVQCYTDDIAETLRQLEGGAVSGTENDDILTTSLPRALTRQDFPEKSDWDKNVQKALAQIVSGKFEKLVLGRRVTLTTDSITDPLAIMSHLSGTNDQTTLFAFKPDGQTSFVGGTPELLYQRDGRNIRSEAIAGTRIRGVDSEDDARLANELEHSAKDIIEVELVRDGIRQSLGPVCEVLTIDQSPQTVRTSSVQHLKFAITGTLRADVNDAYLVTGLNPTPAVGGLPKDGAVKTIAELEPFDRGWYAGPVGWVSRDAATFAVAIRSALIEQREVHLYSGAGLVAESDPEAEWQELETKIGPYLRTFGL